MAKCKLDLNHPYFQKTAKRYAEDPQFQEGLQTAIAKIENEHTSCNRVVQDGMGHKYPQCHGKIWKYDWAPAGQRSKNRKSWRMVVICPDPTRQPYELIAGAVYEKRATDQHSSRELAQIYAEIVAPPKVDRERIPDEFKFNEITDSDGVIHVVCLECATMVIESDDQTQVQEAELQHECEPQ